MNDQWLTDEDINGKESLEEQALREENNKLKKRIVNDEEKIEVLETILDKINGIVKAQIDINIRKTRTEHTIALIKKYREELLILRELEKQLELYNNYKDD